MLGPSFSSCNTSVSVKDLGCQMNWSCSDVTSTMTFTVQTKVQGFDWENVSQCVQITSSSCDLSQVFTDFELYKFVRLELNHGHGKIIWNSTGLCDPLKELNPKFSPPSLSLSLKEQQLQVEVIFPCAPYAICQTERPVTDDNLEKPTCCPLTDYLPLNTTVTLYNKNDRNDIQTLTEVVDGSPCMMNFDEFTPGQEYCAVAHFESSPLSKPQCVHIPQEYPNLFIQVLCGVLVAFLLIMGFVLRRWCCLCASTDLRLPKSLMSLQIQDSEGSVVDEPRQADFEEEESVVHLSIISLNDMLPSNPHSFYPHFHCLGDQYYSTAIMPDRFCDGNDTNYYSRDVEKDGVADCTSPNHYPWPRWSSLPALRTGMVCLLGNFLPSEFSMIPLSSVRVAEEQIVKMESDHSFTVLPNTYSDRDSSSVIC
ncbi:uncharacterized protein si:dkeyp-75h12.7 isoform X2 [Tachysurus fulvidraco]|uniref:uncharacterized protein si:dkeyp-75h12.7 isoform X2 n=1 Tax=Tachysurus fulvidraco TaxID=1234273 RepID=UPI000F4EE8D4|nr:uncharacterized protein si:dkeyp-75h12.7 isoform X2 [Tachysurus fulvidraco]